MAVLVATLQLKSYDRQFPECGAAVVIRNERAIKCECCGTTIVVYDAMPPLNAASVMAVVRDRILDHAVASDSCVKWIPLDSAYWMRSGYVIDDLRKYDNSDTTPLKQIRVSLPRLEGSHPLSDQPKTYPIDSGDLAADRTALEQAGNDRNYAPNAPWAQYEKNISSMLKRYAQDPQPPAKKPEPEKKPSRPTIEEPGERMMSIPFNTED
jgi:hypothetical protein